MVVIVTQPVEHPTAVLGRPQLRHMEVMEQIAGGEVGAEPDNLRSRVQRIGTAKK